MDDRDYDHCWVCGDLMGPDKLHVMIPTGNGLIRHTYCCRRHRYVQVEVPALYLNEEHETRVGAEYRIQERSDHEIESLAFAFRGGQLKPGWE